MDYVSLLLRVCLLAAPDRVKLHQELRLVFHADLQWHGL